MGEGELYRKFGRRLAELRNNAKLTQSDFARKIGISRASVANIERGEQRVYLHQLLSVADALNLNGLDTLVPADLGATPKLRAEVTVSGDKISRAQERAIKELVGSIYFTSRGSKKS